MNPLRRWPFNGHSYYCRGKGVFINELCYKSFSLYLCWRPHWECYLAIWNPILKRYHRLHLP